MRSRLLTIQFWCGVGFAPVAALLLIAGGTKAAAVLAILAVVMLALSVILRQRLGLGGGDHDGAVLDEMDALREDVRADITTAARATHRALVAKIAVLEESVAGLQHQVDTARSLAIEARESADRRSVAAMAVPMPLPRREVASAAVAGVVRHTETVFTRSTVVDEAPNGYRPTTSNDSGGVYGAAIGRGKARVYPPDAHGESDDGASHDRRDRDDDRYSADASERGGVYGRPAVPPAREARPRELSAERSDDLANDPRWSHMRDGDRWAEVRSDDRGRELRMAERRAERHVDDTGTRLRIVDRWSSVREERVVPDRHESRRDEDQHSRHGDDHSRHEDQHSRREDQHSRHGDDHSRHSDEYSRHGDDSGRRDDRDGRDSGESDRGETRAERRRRLEADSDPLLSHRLPATNGVDSAWPPPALPRPRSAPDDFDSVELDRGWRDVRSGRFEPGEDDRAPRIAPELPGRSDRSRSAGESDWAMAKLREIRESDADRAAAPGSRAARRRDSDPRDHDGYRDDRYRDDQRRDDLGGADRQRVDRDGADRYRDDRYRDDRYEGGQREDRHDGDDRGYRDDRHDGADRYRADRYDGGYRDDRYDGADRYRGDRGAAWDGGDSGYSSVDDDRWVREPGPRSTSAPPRLRFEVNDDRWA